MKHILFLCLILQTISQTAVAQNCNGRYETEIFSGYIKTTVQYTDVYTVRPGNGDTLKMDIYEPDGDAFTKRPVVIMAHGGTFVAGDRMESTCVQLCETFAKRGYVAASIDYRLAGSQAELFDSINALRVALKAVSDMKAAVRYFRKDAATGNLFHIDQNQIWVGGNSAGAIAALHVAYVTDTAELPSYIKTIVAGNGGIDGNSGNDGYSSLVSGVINLAGGINKVQWIEPGDVPMVSCHGDNDQTVPYNCNDVLYPDNAIFDLVDLCGSGAMKDWCDQVGTEDSLLTFPGDGHVPWQSSSSKNALMEAYVTSFVAKHTACDSTSVGIRDRALQNAFSVYPNPADGYVVVKLTNALSSPVEVSVFDAVGKLVEQKNFSSNELRLDISSLKPGIYLFQVKSDSRISAAVIHKL